MPSDVIDLLLPRATSALTARARSAVQYLGLLRNHARPVRASTTAVSLALAQELALAEERETAIGALEGLIAQCVRAELGTDTFLWLPEPEGTWTAGWARLCERLDVLEPALELPAPGEPTFGVIRRLVAALERLESRAAARAVFAACATRLERGLASAESELSAALHAELAATSTAAPAGGRAHSVADLAYLVHGIAALRLDRGAVRQARALLDDHLGLAAVEPRLAQLAAWCAWLLDDAGAATELARGAPTAPLLPDALREWQARGGPPLGGAHAVPEASRGAALAEPDHRAACEAALARGDAGAPAAASAHARAASRTRPLSRGEVGACALVLVALDAGEPVLDASDCSPGLRGALDAWWSDRESSHRTSGEPEQRLIAGRCAIVEHRGRTEPLRGCVGGDAVLALALEPVLRGGELLGWLRLEFEHHLVPSRARLLRLAAAAALELDPRGPGVGTRTEPSAAGRGGARRGRRGHRRVGAGSTHPEPLCRSERRVETGAAPSMRGACAPDRGAPFERDRDDHLPQRVPVDAAGADRAGLHAFADASAAAGPGDPRVRCFGELVERLEMKLAQRRWWGFDLQRGAPRLLCEQGGELAAWREQPGRAQALARAIQCQGVAWFDDPDPSQSIHAGSSSGVAVSIAWHGRVIGLLAIESQRRRDLRALDPAVLEDWRASAAEQLRVASFRVWHQRRFGHDVHFDFAAQGLRNTLAELLAAARARRPVALHGPAGTGKRVLARLLHHEAARGAPLVWMHGAVACAERASARLFGTRRREGLWSRARGGTLVVERVCSLPPPLQRSLHEALDAASRGGFADCPRLVATTVAPIHESVAAGALLPCLADHFDGLEIAVPALAQRRDEIPALARHFLERLAQEERLDPPLLGDSCLALLWRQDWPGNLRELEQFLYRIALLCPGREVDAAELSRAAARHRLDLGKRIAPRQAERELVSMALACTRKQNGAFNKSRAASYLGWETETLVARLREFEAQGTPIPEAEA